MTPHDQHRARGVVLATSPADLPVPRASLQELLWPPPAAPQAERRTLEQLLTLGQWLRRLHRGAAPRGSGSPEVAEMAEVAARLDQRPSPLRPAHWASLRQWSMILADDDHLGHGRLGLDHVYPASSHLVVEATQGLSAVHAAVDVGWITADLIELSHRARARGTDPDSFARLLSAFVTGYRGLTDGGRLEDLDVYRAAALRMVRRAGAQDDEEDRDLDLRLARHLVEECWRLGLA